MMVWKGKRATQTFDNAAFFIQILFGEAQCLNILGGDVM